MNDYIEISMNDKICLDSYFKKYIKKIIEYLNKENTKGDCSISIDFVVSDDVICFNKFKTVFSVMQTTSGCKKGIPHNQYMFSIEANTKYKNYLMTGIKAYISQRFQNYFRNTNIYIEKSNQVWTPNDSILYTCYNLDKMRYHKEENFSKSGNITALIFNSIVDDDKYVFYSYITEIKKKIKEKQDYLSEETKLCFTVDGIL